MFVLCLYSDLKRKNIIYMICEIICMIFLLGPVAFLEIHPWPYTKLHLGFFFLRRPPRLFSYLMFLSNCLAWQHFGGYLWTWFCSMQKVIIMFNETWAHAWYWQFWVYYRYYIVFHMHVASQTLVTQFFLQKPNFGTAKLPFFQKEISKKCTRW